MAPQKQRVDARNATIVKRSDYAQTLDAIITGGFCPFCEEHLIKHHRQPLEYKNKHWLVTKNSWPYEGSRYHFLFITRSHVEATEDLSPVMWADLQKLYRKVVREKNIKGATLLLRSGDTKTTGASVNHLHAHLIVGSPRTKNT
ncbi:MAG: HIT domain-containing protein, partial [Candidatus Paceibacterota bacterium]